MKPQSFRALTREEQHYALNVYLAHEVKLDNAFRHYANEGKKNGLLLTEEDIKHAFIYKLIKNRATIESEPRGFGYYKRIIKYQYLDSLDKFHNEGKRIDIDKLSRIGIHPKLAFIEQEEQERRIKILKDSLAKLPLQMQQCLLMKYIDELSSKEIASRLGTTPKNVDMWNFRSKQKLRKMINATDI